MTRATLKLTVVALCAFTVESALAEYTTNYANVDVSRWNCLLCEFESYTGTNGELSVASILTTDDSDRFGRNGSFERAGTRSALIAEVEVNGARGWIVNASATNVGLESNDVAIELKGARSLEAKFRFQQYRRLNESEALTPFRQTNDGLTLGSNWQQDRQTHGFTNLATANRQIELATTRRLLESTVSIEVIPRIELLLFQRSTSKVGVQETFRDGFLQSTALPKTIDQESISNRVQISYRDRRMNAAWSRTNSSFQNSEPVLQWESPYQFGLSTNESANAFSQEHFSDTLDIRWSLPLNSELRVHERRGETRTEPRSLRYGLGALIADTEPVQLFAEHDYRSRRIVVTTDLNDDVELSASRLSYELKDLRASESLTPALGGLFLTPQRSLRLGDQKRLESEIGLFYRPDSGMRVISRIWESSRTRVNQEITRNQSRGLELEFAQPTFDQWEMFTTARIESRDGSMFQGGTINNPHTRRFHQADMKRHAWSAGMRFLFNEDADFVALSVDRERREFPESVLGLTDSEARGLTLSSVFRMGKRMVTDMHVASNRQFAEIKGSQSLDLSMPWNYSSDDVVNSVGLNLLIEPINKFVDSMFVDYTLSDGHAGMETLFDSSKSSFPDQISRHESIDLSVRFAEIHETTIEARIYIEEYEASDWSIDELTQTSLSNVLTMARNNPSYENTLVSLRVNRSF